MSDLNRTFVNSLNRLAANLDALAMPAGADKRLVDDLNAQLKSLREAATRTAQLADAVLVSAKPAKKQKAPPKPVDPGAVDSVAQEIWHVIGSARRGQDAQNLKHHAARLVKANTGQVLREAFKKALSVPSAPKNKADILAAIDRQISDASVDSQTSRRGG